MIISKNCDQRINLIREIQNQENNNNANKISSDIFEIFNRSLINLKLKKGDCFIFEAKCSKTNENILYAEIDIAITDKKAIKKVIKKVIYIVDERDFNLNVSLPLTPNNVFRNKYFCTIEGQINWLDKKGAEQIRNIFCNAVENAVIKIPQLGF